MKQRPLVVKIAVIANAFLLVVAFVGCPGRQDPTIMPPVIRPYGFDDKQKFMPSPIMTVPPNIMPPTISPPPAHFREVVQPPDPPPANSKKTP